MAPRVHAMAICSGVILPRMTLAIFRLSMAQIVSARWTRFVDTF
jgi:hypothetical protein